MTALSSLMLGLRPVHHRLVLVLRVPEEGAGAAAPPVRLPAPLVPRRVGGAAVALLVVTRLRSVRSRVLPASSTLCDHLTYAVPAHAGADGPPVTWIARREGSTRLGRHWREGEGRCTRRRAPFAWDLSPGRLALRVGRADAPELRLRAIEAPARANPAPERVFASAEALASFLGAATACLPHEAAAAVVDDLAQVPGLVPRALVVEELEAPFFADRARFPGALPRLAEAWCWARRREVAAAAEEPVLVPRLGSEALPAL